MPKAETQPRRHRKRCACACHRHHRRKLVFCPVFPVPSPVTPPAPCSCFPLCPLFTSVLPLVPPSSKLLSGTMSCAVLQALSTFPVGQALPCQVILATGMSPVTVLAPTAAEKNGDFSALLPLQIFDPSTGLPFPNNIIPSARLPCAASTGAFAVQFV